MNPPNDPIDAAIARLDALGDGRSRADVPFERAYWIVPGRLLAGAWPGDVDAAVVRARCDALAASDVRSVISLMEAEETGGSGMIDYADTFASRGEVETIRRAIADMATPTVEAMRHTLDAIDGAIAEGRSVFVHCREGRGRTGTVVGCWLARHAIAEPLRIVRLIAALRGRLPDARVASPETDAQAQFVVEWIAAEGAARPRRDAPAA